MAKGTLHMWLKLTCFRWKSSPYYWGGFSLIIWVLQSGEPFSAADQDWIRPWNKNQKDVMWDTNLLLLLALKTEGRTLWAKESKQPLGTGKDKEWIPSRASRKKCSPRMQPWWTSGLQNSKIMNVYCFKPLNCGNLLQLQQKINTKESNKHNYIKGV